MDTHIQKVFKVSPNMAGAIRLLLQNEVVTAKVIEAEQLATQARGLMLRVRRELMNVYGIELHCRKRLGWWLDNENKQKLWDMLEVG